MANIKLHKQAETTTPNAAESRGDIVAALKVDVEEAIKAIYDEHLDAGEVADSGLTIRVKYTPNKEGGEHGKYEPYLVETLTLQDGTEREFITHYGIRSFSSEARAIAAGYSHWPQVRLPESERIRKAIADATATFLGKVQKGVIAARQMTRAYAMCDAEGIDVNDALARIRELDKEVVGSANEKDSDVPTAVSPDSDDSVFE
tara:strand:- start:17780 stop:18388 length:609 start_codon:yes stop_codon:yes gene_type:complete